MKTKTDESKKIIVKMLLPYFPHALPEVIETFVDAMEIHNVKTHDYNGGTQLHEACGVVGSFCELWRKVSRLHVFIIQRRKMMVLDESALQSSLDLVVNAAMLHRMMKKYPDGI